MTYQREMVSHPADPRCPGHDINGVLAAESEKVGFCLCIHPFMNVINFSGCDCSWCGQPVTDSSMTPEAKEIRTHAVRAAFGDGSGDCTDFKEIA